MAGEKPRASQNSKLSFRARVATGFAVVAILTTVLFVVVLSVSWNEEFHNYTRSTLEELADSTAATLERSYANKGYWTASDLETAASSAESLEDIGVQICDAKKTAVYDSTLAASGQTANSYATDMSLAPAASQMVSVDVHGRSDEKVGTVSVWVYGSEYLLTQRDESFRTGSFKAIGVAGFVAVLLSVILGFVISRVLTTPVRTISHTAARIKEGELSARCGVRGKDDLGQLGETFDEMAEKIENDRELERRLTNDMAHELRTPLMSMLATVEAMQDGVYACDQEHLALVRSEITRLSRLVDGMLSLSRLENGSVHMDIVPTDAVELVASIAATHKAMLDEVGLDLRFENACDTDELVVELDRDTITQAVTNFISNAMRYTPATMRSSACRTRVSASPRKTSPACSVDSGAPRRAATAPRAAWVWALPSRRRSPTATTARSRSTPPRAWARRSLCACPSSSPRSSSPRKTRRGFSIERRAASPRRWHGIK